MAGVIFQTINICDRNDIHKFLTVMNNFSLLKVYEKPCEGNSP